MNTKIVKDQKFNHGFSLIEMLVVITVFAIIAALATTALALSIRGSKKSETAVEVKQNLDYALSVIGRNLQNSHAIIGCNSDTTRIDYTTAYNLNASFLCVGLGGADPYVASVSAAVTTRVTNNKVNITACSFTCDPATPPYNVVNVSISGVSSGVTGSEATSITVSSEVFLRGTQRR